MAPAAPAAGRGSWVKGGTPSVVTAFWQDRPNGVEGRPQSRNLSLSRSATAPHPNPANPSNSLPSSIVVNGNGSPSIWTLVPPPACEGQQEKRPASRRSGRPVSAAGKVAARGGGWQRNNDSQEADGCLMTQQLARQSSSASGDQNPLSSSSSFTKGRTGTGCNGKHSKNLNNLRVNVRLPAADKSNVEKGGPWLLDDSSEKHDTLLGQDYTDWTAVIDNITKRRYKETVGGQFAGEFAGDLRVDQRSHTNQEGTWYDAPQTHKAFGVPRPPRKVSTGSTGSTDSLQSRLQALERGSSWSLWTSQSQTPDADDTGPVGWGNPLPLNWKDQGETGDYDEVLLEDTSVQVTGRLCKDMASGDGVVTIDACCAEAQTDSVVPVAVHERGAQCVIEVIKRSAACQASVKVRETGAQAEPWFEGEAHQFGESSTTVANVDQVKSDDVSCQTELLSNQEQCTQTLQRVSDVERSTQTSQIISNVAHCSTQTAHPVPSADLRSVDCGTQTIPEERAVAESGVQTILTGPELPDPTQCNRLQEQIRALEWREVELRQELGGHLAKLREEEARNRQLRDSEASLRSQLEAAENLMKKQIGAKDRWQAAAQLAKEEALSLKGMQLVVSAPRVSIAVGAEDLVVPLDAFPTREIERVVKTDILPRYQRVMAFDSTAADGKPVQKAVTELCEDLCRELHKLIRDACPACSVSSGLGSQQGGSQQGGGASSIASSGGGVASPYARKNSKRLPT